MNYIKKILTFLSGKKSIIGGVIMTTSAYLASQGVLTPETATYINGLTTLIFGSASIATGKMVYGK